MYRVSFFLLQLYYHQIITIIIIVITREGNGDEIISPVASAGITTEKTFSFTYGTIEIRAKMPRGDWISSSVQVTINI